MVLGKALVSRVAGLALVVASLGVSAPAAHADVSALYVFGDSLSDNGNLAAFFVVTFPNPPSYDNSFTNGPVAAALLANKLGVGPLRPSLWTTGITGSGTNYAVAGATAYDPNFPSLPPSRNLPYQIGAYSLNAGGHADLNALYMIMIGGNDVRDAAKSGADMTTMAAAITAAVTTELGAIATLAGEGARNFLVVGVPNVGVIPEFALYAPSLASTATTLSQAYNTALTRGLATLGLPAQDKVRYFDLYGFNSDILADAAKYGLTNTTDPCFTSTPSSAATSLACGTGAANIDQFAFWDEVHPTRQIHELWAAGFAAAVPEPSTWAMMIVGLGLLGVVGAKARRREQSATA